MADWVSDLLEVEGRQKMPFDSRSGSIGPLGPYMDRSRAVKGFLVKGRTLSHSKKHLRCELPSSILPFFKAV